jgi:Methylase involved in ubiquinone/menaquinone biosynthesis
MLQTCNVCENKLIPHFLNILDPITNETFAIHKCTKCGLGHTVPQPKNLSRYYGNVYYGNRHSFTTSYCTRRRLGFVASAINEETGKKLVDIGCGDGSFLLAARDAVWEIVGTEINPGLAQVAGLDVREEIGQLSDYAPFDCITMWHSLEHMRDIKSTLSQLSKLLKPNGKLLIAVPDNGGLQSKIFRHKWLHLDVPRHLYHFDAHSLSFSLRCAGFTIQHQWHQELEYDLIGWSQSALNCFLAVPNVFFYLLTGKQGNFSTLLKISSFAFGLILTALSLPAVAAGTLFGRGGTMITVACRIS